MRIRSVRRLSASALLSLVTVMMLAGTCPSTQARAGTRASTFTLANGLVGVVIPDRRAPVVTHMLWYRVGSADEPRGISGIAHFLEHLMFKSTDGIPSGEFSKIVGRLGGQDNAFTSQDATGYFQRISKDRLKQMMEMEADRMVNLRLTEQEVATERRVVLEERRTRVENNPGSILGEQMSSVLYYSHPYGMPVIGWEHEIAQLSREDALTFYKRHYAPNNVILVVSGDVTPEEVKALAEATFGKIPANPDVKPRVRPKDPEGRSARRVELVDERAGKASLNRYYLAPSYRTAAAGEAEALDLLMKIAASGATSRLYRRLVMADKVASSAGGWYSGGGMDSGTLGFYAVAADGVGLDKVEAAIDAVLTEVRAGGVTEAELERAKKLYLADYIYESDNQSTLARRYGWALVVGRTIADVEEWPERIAKVTVADIGKAAERHFDIRRSVTGILVPRASDVDVARKAGTPGRS
ncbi:MAG: M16 family metallopeptidase [Hyphomicrobiaceae bacterium]